jgi:hypothetical protein
LKINWQALSKRQSKRAAFSEAGIKRMALRELSMANQPLLTKFPGMLRTPEASNTRSASWDASIRTRDPQVRLPVSVEAEEKTRITNTELYFIKSEMAITPSVSATLLPTIAGKLPFRHCHQVISDCKGYQENNWSCYKKP